MTSRFNNQHTQRKHHYPNLQRRPYKSIKTRVTKNTLSEIGVTK